MAEISFRVFCRSTTNGESSEMTPLADNKVFSKLVATPPTRPSRLRASVADIFDGLFRVFRQRIHLVIYPVNQLAGVSQRLFEIPTLAARSGLLERFAIPSRAEFQFRLYCLEIQFIQGPALSLRGWRGWLVSRYIPYRYS